MAVDPILAEIRKVRDEIAARFSYDIAAIVEDARRRQEKSNQKTVSFPPRPARRIPVAARKA